MCVRRSSFLTSSLYRYTSLCAFSHKQSITWSLVWQILGNQHITFLTGLLLSDTCRQSLLKPGNELLWILIQGSGLVVWVDPCYQCIFSMIINRQRCRYRLRFGQSYIILFCLPHHFRLTIDNQLYELLKTVVHSGFISRG